MREFLNGNKMVILNGRKLGDTAGKYTCHKYNGSSVVDLALCNYDFYSKINHFKVAPQPWFTDHCPIML